MANRRSNYMFKAPGAQMGEGTGIAAKVATRNQIEKGAIPVSNKLDMRLMDSMTAT